MYYFNYYYNWLFTIVTASAHKAAVPFLIFIHSAHVTAR